MCRNHLGTDTMGTGDEGQEHGVVHKTQGSRAGGSVSRPRIRLDPTARREQLVRTAIKIFSEDGLERTSVLRITTEAGVSNGVFYYHFADRKELEDAVAEQVITQLVRDMLELQKDLPFTDRIAAGAIASMMKIASDRELGAILVQYYGNSHAAVEQTTDQLAADIRSGGETGEFTVSSPVPFLSGLFLSMFAVGGRSVLDGENPSDVGEFIAAGQLRLLGVPRVRAAATARRVRLLLGRRGAPGAQ